MKILLFGELSVNNIAKLCPQSEIIGNFAISGYKISCSQTGRSFLEKGNDLVEGFILKCDGEDLWRLNQWKDVLFLHLQEIDKEGEIFSYFSIELTDNNSSFNYASEEEINEFVDNCNNGSLHMADVHLLMPGYCHIQPNNNESTYLGQLLQECIQSSNENEFNNRFLKDCKRYSLGQIQISTADDNYQNAVLTLMCHNSTNLCVADIFIPAINTSTHLILEKFCCDKLRVKYHNTVFNLKELCRTIGITQYGSCRSMVFSYEKLGEESLLNLLVNEEKPMGKIVGSYFKNVISNNLAQYDTAEVYATEVTMLEMTDKIENDILVRIQSQAVEIFFVEMLLLQDASVTKMYHRVQKEIAIERENPYRKNAEAIIGELIDEATYSTCFTDYSQFYFPTVRVSAEKVAKAFGIDGIRKRYDQNKALLEQMIKEHNADISKKDNKIKNSLLIIITLLSGTKTICDAFNAVTNSAYTSIAYYIAIAIMLAGVLIYFSMRKIVRFKESKKAKKRLKNKRQKNEL